MSNKAEQRSHFWTSYVDLMTSLFVIMLVLFVLCLVRFNKANKDLQATVKQMETIRQIDSALAKLDTASFQYDKINKRHKLRVEVSFANNSYNFNTIDSVTRTILKKAGIHLYNLMDSLTRKNKEISYLVVVEGMTQRNQSNWKSRLRDTGYVVSYKRALALVNYWQDSVRLDFQHLSNCEIMIAGSGYFSKSRDTVDANKNRRFIIQISPKFSSESVKPTVKKKAL
jgi:hypothetical protein